MIPISDRPLEDLVVDFGTRPSAPKLDTPAPSNHGGRRLMAIHRMHLNDMGRIAMLLDQIEQHGTGAAELAQAVSELDLTENFRRFGSLCGRECKMLTFHHDAEEYHLFPTLESRAPTGVAAVVKRLRDEHEVVHELLTRLERAAMTLMFDGSRKNFDVTRATFQQLFKAIASHFKYEETELEDAINAFVDEF